MTSLDQEQVRVITAAAKKSAGGVKRALDPADAADAAAIHAFLELTGKCPDSHPGLHADLEQLATSSAAAPDDHELQVLDIIDSGRDSQGRATARVWHLDREGTFMSGSLALVLDADKGELLAMGAAHRVGGGLCPAATRSRNARPATRRILVIGFYHSQPHPDSAPRFGMIARTDDIGERKHG